MERRVTDVFFTITTTRRKEIAVRQSGEKEPNVTREWTKKEVFDYLDVDLESDMAKSGQYIATVLIIKKNMGVVLKNVFIAALNPLLKSQLPF